MRCSANSCRGSLCLGYATSWTLCCRNSLQSVPHGMLLGLYGPATTFVPPHMTMDIRFNRGLQLHISSHHMTTSTTCGFNRFQGQAVYRLHQQHIQLGLRKGMAVLVYYRVQSGPPTLHGPFVVMPYVGEGTVNIWPFMKRTWGCRDVLSRRTSSL